jgi:head-tail adaptor
MADGNRRHGALRYRLHFQRRGDLDDGWGNVTPGAGEFETVHTVAAAMTPRTGGEAVTAARLDGRQPFVVTVRWAAWLANVTTAWRLVDARNENRVLNILSPLADPDGKRQWMEFIAQEGGGPS